MSQFKNIIKLSFPLFLGLIFIILFQAYNADSVRAQCASILCTQNCHWDCTPPGCEYGDPGCTCEYNCDGPQFTCVCADWGLGCACPDLSCVWVSGDCDATQTPPPSCTWGPWVDQGCGGNGCADNEQYQTRWTNPSGCTYGSQCVYDPDCECESVSANVQANSSEGPITVDVGSSVTISWTSSGADSCTLEGNSVGTSGSQVFTANSNNTYDLNCSNSCGNSDSDSVTVNVKNWCSISAVKDPVSAPGSFDITLQGRAVGGGSTPIRAWVERKDGTQAEGGETWIGAGAQEYYNAASGRYFYELTDVTCSSSNGSLCTDSASNVSVPNNDYYFHCDAYLSPNESVKCSGNPFCSYEGGDQDCSGWQSCSNIDNDAENFYLPCPTNINELCGMGGTSVQFNWTPFNQAFASYYRTRLGAGVWSEWYPPSFPPTSPYTITPDTSYTWDLQGVRPDRTPAPDDICDAGSFSCGGASCSVVIIPNYNPVELTPNESRTFTAIVSTTPANAGVEEVQFTQSPNTILDPVSFTDTDPDGTGPYYAYATFTATGAIGTSTTITAYADINGVNGCDVDAPVAIVAPPPWWQVWNGDAYSSGNLESLVPAPPTYFSGGTGAGIPFFGGSSNLDKTTVSVPGWIASGVGYFGPEYKYQFFRDRVNSFWNDIISIGNATVTGASFTTGGYRWPDPVTGNYYFYKRIGNLTIQTSNVSGWAANRKVILFVEGDVTISRSVDVSLGTNLFMVIATGNINFTYDLASAIYDGIYVADMLVDTGSNAMTNQFVNNGSTVGWGGFNLDRDLADDTNPSEIFSFGASQVMQIPSIFGKRNVIWKEVVP